jgi:hypothetical protein
MVSISITSDSFVRTKNSKHPCLHPTVSILMISDDTHDLGQLEDVIAAIHTILQQNADSLSMQHSIGYLTCP